METLGNLVAGRKVVTTAGTEVALSATAIAVKRVWITALKANTNQVAIGGNPVVAAAGSETGIVLKPTDQPICLHHTNLAAIYVDSVTNGEGVSFLYEF